MKTTTLSERPKCDVCRLFEGAIKPAYADAYIPGHRQWGYVCKSHFDRYRCQLGMGKGQQILVESEGKVETEVAALLAMSPTFRAVEELVAAANDKGDGDGENGPSCPNCGRFECICDRMEVLYDVYLVSEVDANGKPTKTQLTGRRIWCTANEVEALSAEGFKELVPVKGGDNLRMRRRPPTWCR